MEYKKAKKIADSVVQQLQEHCERIEIAGSIRREKPEVKDIEVVAIAKPYEVGLFASGIATVVNQWEKVKGELPAKYTQRILPEGIKLDLFFAEPGNWGFIFAIRTGSADFSHHILGYKWKEWGYRGKGGYLYREGQKFEIPEERDLFNMLGLDYVEPKYRNT